MIRTALAFAFVLLATGCQKTQGEGGPAPAASASAVTCETYQKALCEKAGPDSDHCTAMRNLVEILPQKACAVAMTEFPATSAKLESEQKPCRDLAERLCKDVGTETASCQSMRTRFPNFPASQCNPTPDQYAQIVADIKKQEAKLLPLDAAKQAQILAAPRVTFGSANSRVKIVEFSDFQCPFCAGASKSVREIRNKFGDQVYFVFRQFPLDFHPDAHLTAEASLAAAAQGKFWEFHDKAFANQGDLKRENLEAYARDVGLDLAKFKKALDDHTYKADVDAEFALGKAIEVEGTPTAYVNGKVVPDLADTPAVIASIENELKK